MTRDGDAPHGSSARSATSRRAFLGLGAGAALGAVAGCTSASGAPAAGGTAAARSSAGRRAVPENSLPGDRHWEIRHLGAANAIEGYAGAASVLTGQPFQLFVSTTSSGFRVRAFRLGFRFYSERSVVTHP